MAERIRLPNKQEGVLFLVLKDNEYLFETVLKKDSGYFAHNRVAGGKIEDGETPAIAAFREVFEEMGIVAKKIVKLGEFYDTTLNNNLVKLHAFLITDHIGTISQRNEEKLKSLITSARAEDADNCLPLASSKLVLEWAKDYLSRQNS